MTDDELLDEAERLLDCACGHGLDQHNGLGCYARLTYEPLVTCDCKLTDNRTYAELLAPRLAGLKRRAWEQGYRRGIRDEAAGSASESPYSGGDIDG